MKIIIDKATLCRFNNVSDVAARGNNWRYKFVTLVFGGLFE